MITISEMTYEDIPIVSRIERICFGNKWTPTSFQKELENPNCFYFVAKKDSIIGYTGYWLILEEVHITSVAVLPKYRRNKISQQLLLYLINHSLERQSKWITLEVKESNIPAIKLYEKFGFKVMGKRKNYYQKDNEDALIMWTDNIREENYINRLIKLQQEIS